MECFKYQSAFHLSIQSAFIRLLSIHDLSRLENIYFNNKWINFTAFKCIRKKNFSNASTTMTCITELQKTKVIKNTVKKIRYIKENYIITIILRAYDWNPNCWKLFPIIRLSSTKLRPPIPIWGSKSRAGFNNLVIPLTNSS